MAISEFINETTQLADMEHAKAVKETFEWSPIAASISELERERA